MIFRKRTVIADNERGLLFRDRQLTAVLTAGVHQYWDFGNRTNVRLFDITDTEITQKDVKVLLRNKASLCKAFYTVITTDENEVALIYVDGQFSDLIKPQSEKWFWNTAAEVRVRRVNVTEQVEVSAKDMKVLAKAAKASVLSAGMVIKEVTNQQVGLLLLHYRLLI